MINGCFFVKIELDSEAKAELFKERESKEKKYATCIQIIADDKVKVKCFHHTQGQTPAL